MTLSELRNTIRGEVHVYEVVESKSGVHAVLEAYKGCLDSLHNDKARSALLDENVKHISAHRDVIVVHVQ